MMVLISISIDNYFVIYIMLYTNIEYKEKPVKLVDSAYQFCELLSIFSIPV